MRKMYLSAPLPFVGQKRMLAKEFMKVLEQYPDVHLAHGGIHKISKDEMPQQTAADGGKWTVRSGADFIGLACRHAGL